MEQAQQLEIFEAQCDGLTNMMTITKRRIKLKQEIDQFGIVIHDLKDNLSAKVDASKIQQINNELCEAKKEF